MNTLLFLGLMTIGTFALGISDVLKRKYLKAGVDDQALLVITFVLTGMLLSPLFLVYGFPQIKPGFWSAFVITLFLNLVGQYLFIKAFKESEASLIAPLRLIIPPLVILTGLLFLGEMPSFFGILGIFISMIGLGYLLIDVRDIKKSKQWLKSKGVVYGLLASILFSVSFTFDKIVVTKSSSLFSSFIIFSSLGITTYLFNLIFNKSFNKTVISISRKYFKQNIIISAFYSTGILLTYQALVYSLVAYASSLKRLQALWTVIIAGKFLQEKELEKRTIATIIMFFGILLTILWK